MKTYRSLLLIASLVGTAAILSAGPGPQYWNRTPAPTSNVAAAAPTTPSTAMVATAACATCACCKKSS